MGGCRRGENGSCTCSFYRGPPTCPAFSNRPDTDDAAALECSWFYNSCLNPLEGCLKTHLWSSSRLPEPFIRQAKYMQWSRPRRCSSSWTVTWIWTSDKLLQIWYDLVPALMGAETSVPYYSLPVIALPYAFFLALWQRSSGNATKSPRNGGTGHTLISHDEVMMYEVWSKGVSLTSWLIRLNVSKHASQHEAANPPVETEDSHSSVPLGQPSNEKVWVFLDEILSAFLSSKKYNSI